MDYPNLTDCKIAIIGLGYVGLPLALEFAKTQICRATKASLSRTVVGFDINQKRLNELQLGIDSTNEALSIDFEEAKNISFTSNPDSLANADVFIVTVPTPIDSSNRPDLIPLKSASKSVGLALRERARLKNTTYPIVIYESTVFPGATEEVCVPIIESYSGLTYRVHFHCGYSPERINPGDRIHRLSDITKVTSGSSELAGKFVDSLYSSIIKAGTYKASSIKVAEASKVIENTQRDLNIALMNFRGSWHKMEFSSISSRHCWWALYWR